MLGSWVALRKANPASRACSAMAFDMHPVSYPTQQVCTGYCWSTCLGLRFWVATTCLFFHAISDCLCACFRSLSKGSSSLHVGTGLVSGHTRITHFEAPSILRQEHGVQSNFHADDAKTQIQADSVETLVQRLHEDHFFPFPCSIPTSGESAP